MMISLNNTLARLFFIIFLATMTGCATNPYELNHSNYTLDDLHEIITAPPNHSSKIFKHPNPKLPSDTGYSYFYETYGKPLNLGKKFHKDHEIRFDEGDSGDRFFRDKNGTIKIMGGYGPITKEEPFELSGIFSEVTDEVVIDKLTNQDGYIVFLVTSKYPPDLLEKKYYLMIARKENTIYSATISRSLFSQTELDRLDSNIKRGPETWNNYFSAEPAGNYLPGSGPGKDIKPASGKIEETYHP